MDQVQELTERHALAFTARRWAFAKLLIVNGLLTVITLGIYRFWAKTRIRRFLWSSATFLDDPLEYTGTGGELFVGFLIVISILFPLGLIYGAIQTLVPPEMFYVSLGLEGIYYLVLYALIQIAFYRMWRYRMSRTRWRGVRFGLDGSTMAYLRLAMGWSVVTLLTLGFALPWMQIDLWRYQVRHTRLGDQAFRFTGNAKSLLGAWLPVFIAGLCVVAAYGGFLYLIAEHTKEELADIFNTNNAALGWLILLFVVMNIATAVGAFHYAVCRMRLQISGLALGAARFHSTLPFWRLFGFLALGIVLFILAFGAISAAVAHFTGAGPWALPGDGINPQLMKSFVVAWVLLFMFLIFIGPFVWALVYQFELIKQLVATTAIENPHALESAAQVVSDSPRTGEGLADALDIGGF